MFKTVKGNLMWAFIMFVFGCVSVYNYDVNEALSIIGSVCCFSAMVMSLIAAYLISKKKPKITDCGWNDDLAG